MEEVILEEESAAYEIDQPNEEDWCDSRERGGSVKIEECKGVQIHADAEPPRGKLHERSCDGNGNLVGRSHGEEH